MTSIIPMSISNENSIRYLGEEGGEGSYLEESEMNTTAPIEEENVMTEYVAPRTLKDYELLKLLGTGGQGSTYLAEVKATNQIVALKVIYIDKMKSNLEMAEKEVQELEKISTPTCNMFLACYYDHFFDGDKFLIESEFIDGKDLENWAKPYYETNSYKELYENLVLLYKDMARALQYIFSKGILHRDIKPQNILIDKENVPKLIDFGLACDMKVCSSFNHPFGKCCHDKLGTPPYMAPETARDAVSYPASDVWGLGATVFKVATTQYCFNFSDVNDIPSVIQTIAYYPPLVLTTVNSNLNYVTNWCLSLNADVRPTPDRILQFLN